MEIHRHVEGRWSYDDGSRGWRDAATSQGHQRLLATSRSWEQARKDHPLEVYREWALQTPLSDFWLSGLRGNKSLVEAIQILALCHRALGN